MLKLHRKERQGKWQPNLKLMPRILLKTQRKLKNLSNRSPKKLEVLSNQKAQKTSSKVALNLKNLKKSAKLNQKVTLKSVRPTTRKLQNRMIKK